MLETTLVALQDISLDKIFDESGRKVLFSEFPKIMEQVASYSLSVGYCDAVRHTRSCLQEKKRFWS